MSGQNEMLSKAEDIADKVCIFYTYTLIMCTYLKVT